MNVYPDPSGEAAKSSAGLKYSGQATDGDPAVEDVELTEPEVGEVLHALVRHGSGVLHVQHLQHRTSREGKIGMMSPVGCESFKIVVIFSFY